MRVTKNQVKRDMCSRGLIWRIRWYLCGWWTYSMFYDKEGNYKF